MSDRTLVTSALIYANGSVHIGHLVEYIQTDIYVRALRLLGEDVVYVCADDTHGTPIEINAGKAGLKPEQFIARWYEEHQRDFVTYGVSFDCFHSTNSPENRHYTEAIYRALRAAGALASQEVDGYYCEHDQRFLPDRFIKGTCPRCGALDQYGDVCESCGATYSPTDLKAPACALCGRPPVNKRSTHQFFDLARYKDFLADWTPRAVGAEISNFVQKWVQDGLRPWCITRDGPYFGFEVPDLPGKYFYVWFDAPIGYIGSTAKWCADHGRDPERDYWKSPASRIVHVIGKDIAYFHTLFWPAVLKASGFNLPERVQVHGFLTVNGEKMSKSRGTFITAADLARHVPPEFLRYYYATHLGPGPDDIDLNFEEFQNRINAELVNKIANLINRVGTIVARNFDGRLAAFDPAAYPQVAEVERRLAAIKELYRQFQFSQVTREVCAIADIGNLYLQEHKPWELIRSDREAAHRVCTFVAHVCQALALALKPIVPDFAARAERVLGLEPQTFATALWRLGGRTLGPVEHLAQRFDRGPLERWIAERAAAQDQPPARPAPAPLAPQITIEQFKTVDLRVGVVRAAEALPKSKKLLRLQIDLGEDQPRQVLAGIAQSYKPEDLPGKTVIVVANLAPATLMGQESRGMVLAVGADPTALATLTVAGAAAPGERVS